MAHSDTVAEPFACVRVTTCTALRRTLRLQYGCGALPHEPVGHGPFLAVVPNTYHRAMWPSGQLDYSAALCGLGNNVGLGPAQAFESGRYTKFHL